MVSCSCSCSSCSCWSSKPKPVLQSAFLLRLVIVKWSFTCFNCYMVFKVGEAPPHTRIEVYALEYELFTTTRVILRQAVLVLLFWMMKMACAQNEYQAATVILQLGKREHDWNYHQEGEHFPMCCDLRQKMQELLKILLRLPKESVHLKVLYLKLKLRFINMH